MKDLLDRLPLVGMVVAVFLTEKYIGEIYLRSDITAAFSSNVFFYLLISILGLAVLWNKTVKRVKSFFLKGIYTLIISAFLLFLSNRVHLLSNSFMNKSSVEVEYIAKLKGVCWGEIGIEDVETKTYDIIPIKESQVAGLVDNDHVFLRFKVGLWGMKYSPEKVN